MISKAERNTLKRSIIKELTDKDSGIFNKKEGYAVYNGTDLSMVMRCVFDGLNKHTDKSIKEEVG